MAKKIEKYFTGFAREIGVNVDRVNFRGITWKPSPKKTMASLHWEAPSAYSMRGIKKSWVRIDPIQWKKASPELRQKVLKHEAIHFLYPKHDRSFEYVAKKYGTDMTLDRMTGKGFSVIGQSEKGKRFFPIINQRFASYEEAKGYINKNRERLLRYYKTIGVRG